MPIDDVRCVLCPVARQPAAAAAASADGDPMQLSAEMAEVVGLDVRWVGQPLCAHHYHPLVARAKMRETGAKRIKHAKRELHAEAKAKQAHAAHACVADSNSEARTRPAAAAASAEAADAAAASAAGVAGVATTAAASVPAPAAGAAESAAAAAASAHADVFDRETGLRLPYSARRVPTQAGSILGVEPIGYIESVFVERNGTPRQPLLVPGARGRLRVLQPMNAHYALEGLEDFSHVWVLFVFHFNENKEVRAKIRPPRLNGASVGLYASRTPHRPVAIGLSVCALEKVEGDVVHLSGIDLVHGTPVLDIKPYIPQYDSIPDARVAQWLRETPSAPLRVTFTEHAIARFKEFESRFRFLRSWEELRDTAVSILSLDIRPPYLKRPDRAGVPIGVCIDTLNVLYRVSDGVCEVFDANLWKNYGDGLPQDAVEPHGLGEQAEALADSHGTDAACHA